MADVFSLVGSYQATPAVGSPSAIASVIAPVDETVTLIRKYYDSIPLNADAPISVPFPSGITSVHVVILKATGGKIRARFTSGDGALQAIPVDGFHATFSRSVPFTAIDLTRVPGTPTVVDVFIGQIT